MVLTPHRIVALGVLALFAAACEAPTTGPNVEVAFAKGGNGGGQACPIPADVVVTDEASILAAIASAAPGDVIGVDGTIGLTAALFLDAPGVTYTCATQGSGFTALTPFGGSNLLFAPVADVTVSDLVLDGSAVVGAFLATNNANPAFNAADVAVTDNDILCGTGRCVFFNGVSGVTFTGNTVVQSQVSATGVHIQGNGAILPDGSRERTSRGVTVTGNTIETSAPSTNPSFGGIRLHSTADVEVAHNRVVGPWMNSLAPTDTRGLVAAGNHLEGAQLYGIGGDFNTFIAVSQEGNVYRNNRTTGSGFAGIFLQSACGNTFVGNNVQNSGPEQVVFDGGTGANVWVGAGNGVTNNGVRDCDGDGNPDSNIIGGKGAAAQGANLGHLVSNATVPTNTGAEIN